MDSVGEGEGGEIWENGIETCIISRMKRVTSPGSMHDTGCLGLDQEGPVPLDPAPPVVGVCAEEEDQPTFAM